MRANQLVGYGLVVGLPGTGDRLRNSPFTQASLQSMLERMGVSVGGTDGNRTGSTQRPRVYVEALAARD